MMKHTKGKLIENPKAKGNIMSETGRSIASCMGYSSSINPDKIMEENLANTKRIIKCWNTHDELLDVCLKFRDIIANGKAVIKAEKGQSKYITDWVLENIEAIKKATE